MTTLYQNIDPLHPYLLSALSLNDVLSLRSTCKIFDAYAKNILHNYELKIKSFEQFNIPKNILNYFTKCVIHRFKLGPYQEFSKMVGDKFVTSTIKSYRFNLTRTMHELFYRHFCDGDSYIFYGCEISQSMVRFLENAKHLEFIRCYGTNTISFPDDSKITYFSAEERNDHIHYSENFIPKNVKRLKIVIANFITNNLNLSHCKCDEYDLTMAYIRITELVHSAKIYRLNGTIHPGDTENIMDAEEYYFTNCKLTTESMKHLCNAKIYSFTDEFNIIDSDLMYIKGGDEYTFTTKNKEIELISDYGVLGKIKKFTLSAFKFKDIVSLPEANIYILKLPKDVVVYLADYFKIGFVIKYRKCNISYDKFMQMVNKRRNSTSMVEFEVYRIL